MLLREVILTLNKEAAEASLWIYNPFFTSGYEGSKPGCAKQSELTEDSANLLVEKAPDCLEEAGVESEEQLSEKDHQHLIEEVLFIVFLQI